jgi:hypothetical protein
MMRLVLLFFVLFPIHCLLAGNASIAQTPEAAGPWDPASRIAAQREAMRALAFMDGEWRGRAVVDGGRMAVVHTERAGPLLDGSLRVVEGRAYDETGATAFNAFGIISYDPVRRTYSMHSYAMGYAGDFPLEVRPDGYSWTQPTGPGSTIRYTATVRDGEWHEVGERVANGAAPTRMFEMRLRRIGDSAWPGAGAVPAQ